MQTTAQPKTIDWPEAGEGPCACRFVRRKYMGECEQIEWCGMHAEQRDALNDLTRHSTNETPAEVAADARRWRAVRQRHAVALTCLATGSGAYSSHTAPAILDAWADMAAAEIEAFDPEAYRAEIAERLEASENADRGEA